MTKPRNFKDSAKEMIKEKARRQIAGLVKPDPDPVSNFLTRLILLAGLAYGGWWLSDRVANQGYYSVLGEKETEIKTRYERLRLTSHINAEGLSLSLKEQIKSEITRREERELQDAKSLVDKQFGRN
jgi:hypothetical protein